MRVLVVEDDASLLHGIVEGLKEEGYEVDCASEGDEGLFLAEQNIYDALILDIMLPGMTGLDILKKLRKQKVLTKVIFLTAKDSVEDRVKGLDYGADDYLVKPFAMAELFARLRVMLRDLQAEEGMISYGPISIREANHEVMINGSTLTLTTKEFQLLEYFIRNKEQILIRDQIFNRVWGFTSDVGVGVVDVYVHHLRKKLQPFNCDNYVRTVRGVGFMLKGEEHV
ncbi:response regulator transcription factor [Priestia aryabhattai]|uniref:Response regulator transcription factor n=1 Tax=Priestia aryabhattai TaxID=412384 RepID=A0ABD7WX37_PRIAR|nr:response regulator transcription factor [Priestia aryabhattai]WEA44637.1 response regulator transcription factor [Priestia aryabhattai]